MLELLSRSAFSFFWNADPPQWTMREGELGQKRAAIHRAPFVIGRALDCQLVLPNSDELSRTTSRWHCHIVEKGGKTILLDGSLGVIPETGEKKPSVSGTFLNGTKISGPVELKSGDSLSIGPWILGVETSKKNESVNIDGMLTQIGAAAPVEMPSGDSRFKSGFAELQDLYSQLNKTYNSDESLAIALSFAMERIRAAEVAAILIHAPLGESVVRMAWKRNVGRLFDFKFSKGLVAGIPQEKSYLLAGGGDMDMTKSQIDIRINSCLLVPLKGSASRAGLLYMDNRDGVVVFTQQDLALANALANVISMQLSLEKQAYLSQVEANMRQYFSPAAARLITEQSRLGRPVNLGVRESEASIIFVDMVDFSAFCRSHAPEEISELLNPYFALAAEVIQRNHGHVDKFIGDGVLGVFGAQPLAAGGDAGRSLGHVVQAAKAAREIIWGWQKISMERWKAAIPLRVGLNVGKVVIGNIGSPGRMEYSVLGDTVNLASRLEKHAPNNGIAAIDAAYQLVSNEFPRAQACEEDIRGFGTVKIWKLSV